MPTLEDAVQLALDAHRGKVDRIGEPYILHPLRVMARVNTDTERIIAVLHDVIEDTDITLDDLRSRGRSEELAAATGRSARPAAEFRGFLQREQTARIACADGLHCARVLAIARR